MTDIPVVEFTIYKKKVTYQHTGDLNLREIRVSGPGYISRYIAETIENELKTQSIDIKDTTIDYHSEQIDDGDVVLTLDAKKQSSDKSFNEIEANAIAALSGLEKEITDNPSLKFAHDHAAIQSRMR